MKVSDLPVFGKLPDILNELRSNANLVISAPPGSGKSTLIPPGLLNETWLEQKKVILLQPRRLAARMAASRMAELDRSKVGEKIGYQVRFDQKISKSTRIIVLTEGILTRKIQTDPFLSDIGVVIFDEFHERSIHSDVGLAMVREIQQTVRPELKIIVMSATLDIDQVAGYLQNCRKYKVDAKVFPVSVSYLPKPSNKHICDLVFQKIKDLNRSDFSDCPVGDILVFLPGAPEIYSTIRMLENFRELSGWKLFPLYGGLTLDKQNDVLRPLGVRKIILATNIAETSLTIEGVTIVIDTGYRRCIRLNPSTGLEGLVTERISMDSADQRAGRAGRTAPGRAYRLWSVPEHNSFSKHSPSEISYSDLSNLVLEMAVWGKHDPKEYDLIESPPPSSLVMADNLLKNLGALAEDSKPTQIGRQMADIPAHPRLARMLVFAHNFDCTFEACTVAAILSEKDPLPRYERDFPEGGVSSGHFSEIHPTREGTGTTVVGKCDLFSRLELLRDFQATRSISGSVDIHLLKRIEKTAKQFRQVICLHNFEKKAVAKDETILLKCLLAGFPDRVARKRAKSASFRMVGGRGMELSRFSEVKNSEFIIGLSIDSIRKSPDENGVIHLASHIEPHWLEEMFPAEISVNREVFWEPDSERVSAQSKKRYRDIIIEIKQTPIMPNELPSACEILIKEMVKNLQRSLDFNSETEQFFTRIRLAAKIPGTKFSVTDDEWVSSQKVSGNVAGPTLPTTVDECNRPGPCEFFAADGIMSRSPGWARATTSHSEGGHSPSCHEPEQAGASPVEKIHEWLPKALARICHGCLSFADTRKIDFVKEMKEFIGYKALAKLDKELPESITVPSGSRVRIKYNEAGPAVLAVKLQELFGLTNSPVIAQGKMPVQIHLLSPAGRPIQVTSDLETFWKTSYHQVRKEMKGRYPKHAWPEDPFSVQAHRGTKKHLKN